MARIVEVHYPGIKHRLVEEALKIFFDVREVPGLQEEALHLGAARLAQAPAVRGYRSRAAARARHPQAHPAAARGAVEERAGCEPVREAGLHRQTGRALMLRLLLLRHAKSAWPGGMLDRRPAPRQAGAGGSPRHGRLPEEGTARARSRHRLAGAADAGDLGAGAADRRRDRDAHRRADLRGARRPACWRSCARWSRGSALS